MLKFCILLLAWTSCGPAAPQPDDARASDAGPDLQNCDGCRPQDCDPGYVRDDGPDSGHFCRLLVPPGAIYPAATRCGANKAGRIVIEFQVSDRARAAQVVPFVPSPHTLDPVRLRRPDGTWLAINRANGFDVRNSLGTPVLPVALPPRYWERNMLQPGTWAIEVATDALEGCAYLAETTAVGQHLDLRIHLVGLTELNAGTAPLDATLQQVLTGVDEILGGVDVSLGRVEYRDATPDVAEAYQFPKTFAAVEELLETSESLGADDNLYVDLFLVRDLLEEVAVGFSGGIPGPAGLHGSSASGVVVAYDRLADEPELAAQIAAHEIGHFLGLMHTTETDEAAHDNHDDTVEGLDGIRATTNLMFPFASDLALHLLSGEQRWVVKTNPLLRPEAGCDCDPLASCSSGSCTCVDSTAGDGSRCSNIDGCSETLPGCAPRGRCGDQLIGRTCLCDPRYFGDGETCNELLQCPVGFHQVGAACEDIDECTSGYMVNCDSDATCVNLPGSFECICNAGYRGDGHHCRDIDECVESSPCPGLGCENTLGGVNCVCPRGTVGVPPSCTARGLRWTTLAVSTDTSCGLRLDGSVRCWGDTAKIGSYRVGPFTQIAMGTDFACGIRENFTIECWGEGAPVTRPGGSYRELDCEHETCCAVRLNGTMDCWGLYQQSVGPFADVSISDGTYCAIRLDGFVVCGPSSRRPPDGVYNEVSRGKQTEVDSLFVTRVQDACGLRTDQTVACSGSAIAPPGSFLSLTSQGDEWCGIDLNGTVSCWLTTAAATGVGPPPGGQFVEISYADDHACGVLARGAVTCWGDDSSGESTVPAHLQ